MIRWRIAILVSAAIAISYLDRQTLPVAVSAIKHDIPMTDGGFAALNSAFLIAYGLMYAGGGKLMDVLGTRLGFAVVMVFWSLACASHGLARNVTMLAGSRLLLGIGEGGGIPAATRAVVEWFPVRERSTAMGIINAGTAVGAIVAPPLIALVLTHGDWGEFARWRWIFFITGALGLLWTIWWWADYLPPQSHPKVGAAELRSARDGAPLPRCAEPTMGWLELFRYRETWGLVGAKFLSDAAWYFYLFWLPKYLYDARGFDIKGVGAFAWIPHVAAGIGCLVAGSFSSWLLRRQYSLNVARKLSLGASAALMPLVLFVPRVPVGWAIALFLCSLFRSAVVVDARDDSPHRSLSPPRHGLDRGPGGLRRRNGRRGFRPTGGLPARPRGGLCPGLRAGRIVSRDRLPRHPRDHPHARAAAREVGRRGIFNTGHRGLVGLITPQRNPERAPPMKRHAIRLLAVLALFGLGAGGASPGPGAVERRAGGSRGEYPGHDCRRCLPNEGPASPDLAVLRLPTSRITPT